MTEQTRFDWLDRLSDATRQAIEYFCIRFQSEWDAGRRPRLEGYLGSLKDADGRPALLAELLPIEVEQRRRIGEHPKADEYLLRFREHAAVIQHVLGKSDATTDTTLPPTLHPGPPKVAVAKVDEVTPDGPTRFARPGATPTPAPPPLASPVNIDPDAATLMGSARPVRMSLPALPGYEIMKELGRGGMGVVLQAKQLGTNRIVAVKLLLSADYADPSALARFMIEGEMLGRLQHPNIVQIYDVGTHEGRAFLALEYVSGGNLADRLDDKPMLSREAARLIELLARAVHYAHSQGVIHRDLKPANVLIASSPLSPGGRGAGGEGEAFATLSPSPQPSPARGEGEIGGIGNPKITDFGIARAVESDQSLTETGQVMGTPSYMSPEQARCDKHIGPAADIYALGVMLYEMITGKVPFRGNTSVETLLKVVNDEPQPPRRLNPRIPLDLETICLKSMEKEVQRRYDSAEHLADDLKRFIDGEPISARPVSPVERLWKWARRKPALATLSAAVVVALLAGFIGISIAWWYALAGWNEADRQKGQVDQQRRQADARRQDAETAKNLAEKRRQEAETAKVQAETARKEADDARKRTELANYFGAIARARLEWQMNNAPGARATLDLCPPALRGWEWHYLSSLHRAARWTAPGNPPYVFGLAFRPDGKLIASAGGGNPFFGSQGPESIRPGDVRLWDAATGKPFAVALGHTNVVLNVAFSKDGSLMASTGCDGMVLVWDTTTGKRRFTLGQPKTIGLSPRSALAFSPDGTRLAALVPHQVTLWDMQTGKKALDLESFSNDIAWGMAYLPDGKGLVTFHGAHLRVWDTANGKQIREIPAGAGRGSALSPDGARMAVPAGRTIKVIDMATGQIVQILSGHTGGVLAAEFSPDSKRIASGSDDHTVRLWDVGSGTELAIYRGHRGRVTCLAFASDGQSLASAEEQPGEVKLWDLTRHPETVICHGAGNTQAIGFSDDARSLIAVAPGAVRIYDAANGKQKTQHPFKMADGQNVVPSQVASLSADGRRIASVAPDLQSVQVWELQGETLAPRLLRAFDPEKAKIYRLAISPNGQRVCALLLDPTQPKQPVEVKVWDAASGQVMTTFRPLGIMAVGFYGGAAFSGDGRRLAFDDYGRGANVQVIDLAAGKVLSTQTDPVQDVGGLAMSADGRLVAMTGVDGQVTVWEAATGRAMFGRRLTGSEKSLFDLSFSPDGRLLAGVSREEVHVWELVTGQEMLVLRGSPPRSGDNAFNPRICWSANSRRLAAVNHNGTVSIWSGEVESK